MGAEETRKRKVGKKRAKVRAGPRPRLRSSNFYHVLGVQRTDSALTIRRAYRQLCRQFHPDRNQDEESVSQFALLSIAMHTLGDAKLRATYDGQLDRCAAQMSSLGSSSPHPLPNSAGRFPAIDGFEALSVWSKYESREAMELLAKVPELEAEFKLPRALRFREGVPCDGFSCVTDPSLPLLRLREKEYAPTDDSVVMLCVKHCALHLCEAKCKTDEDRCALYGMWLAQKWHRDINTDRERAMSSIREQHESVRRKEERRRLKKVGQGKADAKLLSSEDPTEKLIKAERLPEDCKRQDNHTRAPAPGAEEANPQESTDAAETRGPARTECQRETCEEKEESPGRGFVRLSAGIWVCKQHPRPHICSSTTCQWLRAAKNGDMYCWASQRWYTGLVAAQLNQAGQLEPRSGGALGVSLSSRKRMISWIDEKTLEKHELIVDVPWGMDIGEEIEEFEQHPIGVLARRHQKRLAGPASAPPPKKKKKSTIRGKGTRARVRRNPSAEDEDSEEEDIYDNAEQTGTYHTYVMDHDVVEEDLEKIGDYRTVLAGRLGYNEVDEAAQEELLDAANEELHEADELLKLLSAAESKQSIDSGKKKALTARAQEAVDRLSHM